MELTPQSQSVAAREVREAVDHVEARLGFTRASDVSIDTLRPGGVLRAASYRSDADQEKALDARMCRIHDCAAPGAFRPSLADNGFDTIDLSALRGLQGALERVRSTGRMTEADAREVRRRLWGRSFRLSDRKRLRILYVAPEGTILRKGGPNGRKADPDAKMTQTDGHEAAVAVHADQDVRGTPLRQILRGLAPWIFRHDAPDGCNRRSPIFLVNVWIPLEQVTRPLALMDERTLDRRRHQLRYALPTEGFLDRDEDRRVNDIWTIAHDDAQRWYFTSDMDASRAYVFNTLGTPHGSFVAPGEAEAERLHLRLRDVRDAIARRDVAGVLEHAAPGGRSLPSDTTAALRRAIGEMESLLAEARARSVELCAGEGDAWCERAARAMDRVVRKSIELRALALVTPALFSR